MRPTQRNLTKKSILLLSLLFSAISPMVAGQDVNTVANIENDICRSRVDNDGNIDLDVAGVGGFIGNVSAENYHPDGKEFTITVRDCTLQDIRNVLNQLHINLCAPSGAMATGFNQIFANEDNVGAKNVGVVTSSIQDPANTFNVPSAAGNSRSVYPIMSSALDNPSWKFSTRM